MKYLIRKIVILSVLLIFSIFAQPSLAQNQIFKIYFTGIEKTKENYLHHFIQSRENENFDSLQVASDAQKLRNLHLFKKVEYRISESDSGKIIEFNCPELYTLLPIINFGGVTDNFWFQVGALDYNWLGMGNTLGGYYRYYDRHSFSVIFKAPYLLNDHWGLSFDLAKFSTIEPAYFKEGVADYNVDHWNFISHFIYNISINNTLELGGGFLYERYDKNEIRSGQNAPGPDFRDYNKSLTKIVFRNDYVDYNYQYVNGYYNELTLENVSSFSNEDLFWKILNISKFFFKTHLSGNLAFRLRLGISTNKDSPFVPFVLDNYINVRGSGNRVSRGTSEITINTEYRQTLWEHYYGALQGVVFMDMSAWRPAAGKFSDMFTDTYNVTFGGFGLRFYFKKFNNFIFRIDYGKSVTGNKGKGFVLGAGQYF